MSKFTRKPTTPSTASVDDFIAGAGQTSVVSSNIISYDTISNDTISYPWEDMTLREDVLKVYNLRLPEAYLMKLKYIAEHTPDSMQQFCLAALLPAIDAKIGELTKSV